MRVREKLTSATAALMRRHGVAGTGIAQIVTTSGVTRRSIYLNFPGGKAELMAAATRSVGDQMSAGLRGLVEGAHPVAAFAQMWSELLQSDEFAGGCPIVAAACGGDEAPDAADTAADVFAEWERTLAAKFVDEGIDAGTAASLSTTVVAAVEGATILSRAARSTEPLEHVAGHLDELIALHRPS